MSDGGGRLLRWREGHSQPPGRIRYYGAAGDSILSAGLDSSLRVFSTITDLLNKSLGHASYNRLMLQLSLSNILIIFRYFKNYLTPSLIDINVKIIVKV